MAGNQQQQDGAKRMTENEVLTVGHRLDYVLFRLIDRRDELEAVLPPDIKFDQFHATINQALRNNLDLLDCTSASVVNACVKSAYDGLRVDGREAALVSHNVKVSKGNQPAKYEKQAQYFPMVFGMIQTILRGGMVKSIEAEIIYENDKYLISRGTNPEIQHFPYIAGDRGAPLAVYSIATLTDGAKTVVWMTRDEVEEVRKSSKSGNDKDGNASGIWKKWWTQMWVKTVIRRHRKSLPVGNGRIVDMEAAEMFPQFDRSAAHPQLGTAAPARPTRDSLQYQPDNSTPLDLGNSPQADDDREMVVQQDQGEQQKPAKEQAKREPEIELPESPDAWRAWAGNLDRIVASTKAAPAVSALFTAERPRIKACPDTELADAVSTLFTDRLADLASGPATGAGPDAGDTQPAGDDNAE